MPGQTSDRRSIPLAQRNTCLGPSCEPRSNHDPVEVYAQESSLEIWLPNHAATALVTIMSMLKPGFGTSSTLAVRIWVGFSLASDVSRMASIMTATWFL